MAKTPNRLKDGDEFSTFTNGEYIRKKADGTGFESAPAGGGSVDTSGTPVANDYARFTDSNTIEGRDTAEVIADLGLAALYAPASHNHDANQITSGTLATARIAANSLAYGKIQEVTQGSRILGRSVGAGQGVIEELTAAQVNAMTLGVVGPSSAIVDNLATYTATTGKAIGDSSVSIASVNTAISHVSDTANPHDISTQNLLSGSFANLMALVDDVDLNDITQWGDAGATTDGWVLTADSGAIIWAEAGTPTEDNNLETTCTNILVDEVPVGSATSGIATYKPLVSGVLKYATGGAFSAATIGDLMTAGSGISFTSSTLNVGAGTGVTVGTDDISVNYGTTSTTACVGNDARLKAPPKAVTVETPVSGNVILMGRSDRTLTIANVHGVIDSGNSVIVSLDSGASRATSDQQHVNAQTVNSTTTGNDLTKTDNLTFDAGDWIWLTIGTVSGTVGSICITVSFT